MSVAMSMNEPAADWTVEPPAACATKLRQLAVAREMIASLDTLTSAGQRHMMGKILSLLRTHATSSGGARSQRKVMDLVDQLSADSERLWPDAGGFGRCAESLLSLLLTVA